MPLVDGGSKSVSVQEARAALAAERARGKTVAFTNGCFDVLHVGHLHLLREARKTADLLVVGVNSDASVRALKGPTRPIFPEGDRVAMLAAYPFVDLVVAFGEPTPRALIEALEPDVLVKGADYRPEAIVGAEVVLSRGGRVVRVGLVAGRSTTGAVAAARVGRRAV